MTFFLFGLSLFLFQYQHSLGKRLHLVGRIFPDDKREYTLRLCFELLEQREAKILVETGTARNGFKNCRGDGARQSSLHIGPKTIMPLYFPSTSAPKPLNIPEKQ